MQLFSSTSVRGGCKSGCQSLQVEAERARHRLELANKALVTAPAEKNRALLATTLGLPPALLEIVPALLFSTALNGLAFTLLAFGAHAPSQGAAAAPEGPAEVSASQGRAEQVRSFVEAYRKRHGRDPTFSDVRNDLKLPPSTASVYLRKALAHPWETYVAKSRHFDAYGVARACPDCASPCASPVDRPRAQFRQCNERLTLQLLQ
jgi:hypothetical protein